MEPRNNEQPTIPMNGSDHHESNISHEDQEAAFLKKEIASFQALPSLAEEMAQVAKDLGIELEDSTIARLRDADQEIQNDFAFLKARIEKDGISIAA